jgi:hypothetical protein
MEPCVSCIICSHSLGNEKTEYNRILYLREKATPRQMKEVKLGSRNEDVTEWSN